MTEPNLDKLDQDITDILLEHLVLANDGRAINELVIRHNKLFFMIDLDAETGLPTGDFGWSQDTPQTPTPVREHFKTVRLYGEVK